MAHWTMERQEAAATPAVPERVGGAGWTAAWLTGAVALAGEGTLALVVAFLAGLREEHYVAAGFGAYVGYLLFAVITAIALGLAGLIVSAAAVLPVVQLSRWSASRAGRAETVRWCLAACGVFATVAAVGTGVPTILLGGSWSVPALVLLVAFLGMAPAALCARAVTVRRGTGARFGLGAVVLGCGLALSSVVFAGGLAAYATGLVQIYEPPRLTEAQLVGTWTDDQGGTLTLRADGTAVADDLDVRMYEDASRRCSGSGTWARGTSPSGTPQVALSISDCLEKRGWEFGGTEERPTLYYWIGDPDSLNQHTLNRGAPLP
ncbi:hypothetical protein ACX6XY_26385 [Streptomyces sp. O3]